MPIAVIENPSPTSPEILQAANILRRGGLVAFPTETVYGLGANALNAAAVEKIFATKGRPDWNPLIVHVASAAAAKQLVAHWDERAERLAAAFWPGPLTMVLAKSPEVPDLVTAGLPTVAIRVPSHPVALALLEAAQLPLAAPSANRSTEISPTRAEHVLKSLGGRVDLILDGGETQVGIESTVVDLSDITARLLRPGVISMTQLRAVMPFEAARERREGETMKSPGQMDRHYAPRAFVRLFDRTEMAEVKKEIAAAQHVGERCALLALDRIDLGASYFIQMPAHPDKYAQQLYRALHDLDDAGCDLAFIERPPAAAEWDAVHDRLRRAAH